MKNTIRAGLAVTILLAGAVQVLSAGDAKRSEEKKQPYPLKTCVVSGEKLGSMGDPYVYKHEGQEVRFCCKGCLKDFTKEPGKYLKKIEKARKDQPNGKETAEKATE